MKNLTWPHKIVFILNIGCALLLLLSYSASYISPKVFWPLSFLGLAYPLILLINIFFVGYWALFRKKQFLLSLLLIFLGWKHIQSHFQFSFENKERPENPLRILTYNVRLFDLYEWSGDKLTDNNIVDLIQQSDADIICMQEFMYHADGDIISVDSMLKTFKANQYHAEYTAIYNPTNKLGIATFSSFPIINKGRIDFGKGTHNICIYTDIKVKEDTLRIYNAHFQSLHFGKEDYIVLEKIEAEKDSNEQWLGIRKILRKMKHAFTRRASQAEIVAEHISLSPYPVIFCGDFNDTPGSYTYQTVADQLKDAFVEKGNEISNTYNGLFPFFRIDYILHSKELECVEYKKLNQKLSDHFPISCSIRLKSH